MDFISTREELRQQYKPAQEGALRKELRAFDGHCRTFIAKSPFVLIGTSDLSSELGIAGQMGHRKVVDAYASVGAACRKHGKVLGMGGVYDQENASRYVGMGARFVLTGSDHNYILTGANARSSFFAELPAAAADLGKKATRDRT